MDFKPMMKGLLKGMVVPRTQLDEPWNDKGGIYSIWGNSTLKSMLLPEAFVLHASKQNEHEVTLSMRKAIKRSVKRYDEAGNELFCFYVGKTAHLKKRMAIQRYPKVWQLLRLESSSDLKAMLQISFCQMPSWEERFFAEGYAIAMLLPVMNAQPER